ncbi:transketolase [Bdellovibrionota bacterium FG-2]
MLGLAQDPRFIFISGDLGFNSFESLQQILGHRFINAGVAEQNMVSVAAGLASQGFRPWVYSIAPFIYARAFEQIRNDICHHRLPVTLVGNGAGYGYGVMGPTHHALEDYGVLSTLGFLCIYLPMNSGDLGSVCIAAQDRCAPAYVRLGINEDLAFCSQIPYGSFRKLVEGQGSVVVSTGTIAAVMASKFRALPEETRPEVWVISELPILPECLPVEFLSSLKRKTLLVIEEHSPNGGIGQQLLYQLAMKGVMPMKFIHRAALGYPSKTYGSQFFHQKECGLDPDSLLQFVLDSFPWRENH